MTLLLAAHADEFRAALREWFLRERRQMPWRRERSVYRTVVSEFMLQQTQVDTVIPYFENWIQKWGGFEALAQADESEVLRAWEGLGYYSRAKNLLGVAKRIVAEKHIPQSVEEWRDFKGIGAYTAAAIASISQGVPAAVVDGNVVRILARLSGNENVFRDSASAATAFSGLADALLDAENPGDHNEAMMELGALICTKHSPKCEVCPVARFCRARERGIEAQLPRFLPKATKKVEVVRLWCRIGDEILLVRNTAGTRRLKNLCEFPRAEDFSPFPKASAKWTQIFEGRRGIANEAITERFLCVPEKNVARLEKSFSGKESEIFRVKISESEKLTLSGPHRKWLPLLLKNSA